MTTCYEPDTYYRINPFAKNWVATSGIMTHCQEHKCFWVLDVLASYVPTLATLKEVDYFLIVEVAVQPDHSAIFTIKQERHDDPEETTCRTLVQQAIEFTDLKESWKFWAINESSGAYDPVCQTVVLLPEEY